MDKEAPRKMSHLQRLKSSRSVKTLEGTEEKKESRKKLDCVRRSENQTVVVLLEKK